ncbi:MAG: hypothetical protein AAGJ81_04950 [Verrucomicrobiota bacterium]
MKRAIPFFALCLSACCTQVSATLVAYWNMDGSTVPSKLSVTSGSQAGSITAGILDINGTVDPLIAGTSINVEGPVGSPNYALGFYRTTTIFNDGRFLMEGFNFSELTDVSVSFAYRSLGAFTWDSNLEVDYRIGNSSWVDVAELETWQSGYGLASIDLGSAVSGQEDVDIRIRTVNWLSIYGYLDVDNIQVNAVPEPSGAAFWISAFAVGMIGFLRRNGDRRTYS